MTLARCALAIGLLLSAFYVGRWQGTYETVRSLNGVIHILERRVCTRET